MSCSSPGCGAFCGPDPCLLHIDGVPLHDLALRVLLTPDSSAKASLTAAIASAWLAGSIPLHGSRPFDAAALVPSAPARPPDVAVVHPSRVKSGIKTLTFRGI